MIDDATEQELADMVAAHAVGARPIEQAQIEVLFAILTELRTLRKDFAGALNRSGDMLCVEVDKV